MCHTNSHQFQGVGPPPTDNLPFLSAVSQSQPAVPAGSMGKAPPIPMATSVTAPLAAPSAAPITAPLSMPAEIPEIPISKIKEVMQEDLAEIVVNRGKDAAALVAVNHRHLIDPNDQNTPFDLLQRDAGYVQRFGQQKYDTLHQGSANSIALRFSAPNPGPSFPFEQDSVNPKVWKCGDPNCTSRWTNGKDKTRHMNERHVKDITTAFCCPYKGCHKVFYNASRHSEAVGHLHDHVAKGDVLSPPPLPPQVRNTEPLPL